MTYHNARLEVVYQAVHDDPFWDGLRRPGITLVEGYGQRNPEFCRVMIVGEAPGATENARGRPFCGPSGRVLKHLMERARLRLDDLPNQYVMTPDGHEGQLHEEPYDEWGANAFVTNVVKYRPPGNRTPTLAEIEHGKKTLRYEWMALGGPPAIVCVGGVAHSAMSPMSGVCSISMVAGTGYHTMADNKTICFSQLHPAYGLRKGVAVQQMMEEHWAVMGEMLMEEEII